MKIQHVFILLIVFLNSNGHNNMNLTGLLLTRNDINIFHNKKLSSDQHSVLIKDIQENKPAIYECIQKNYMWHHAVPTTGFYSDLSSSSIPYWFSLWDLAPKKGRGVTVAILDTGVAAFESVDEKISIKNFNLSFSAWQPYENYNCCARGLQAFVKYMTTFLKSEKSIEESDIIPLLVEYCTTRKTDLLYLFLKEHGVKDLFDKGIPTTLGKDALYELTLGRRGMMPRGKNRFFTPLELKYPFQQKCIFEFLPLPTESLNFKNYCLAAHGTHCFGLINAQPHIFDSGLYGLAPNAHCIMIKICNENGTSDVETVLYALKKAQSLNADIVNISLKIETDGHNDLCKSLETQLKSFMFIVAASGNALPFEPCNKEAYPACLKMVAFDVGAFSYDGNQYAMCPFSKYEKSKGPKFVAPGFNILSTGIPFRGGEYLFLSGTSMATALISGFVALMLAEFKEDFSREQLLKVCYISTKRLGKSLEWQEKCLLGVLDMRMVLFTLHVCKALKNRLNVENDVFQKNFDAYVQAIQMIVHELAIRPDERCRQTYNLAQIIDFFVVFISSAEKKINKKFCTHELMNKVQLIFAKNAKDLFSVFDIEVRERLISVIYPE